VYSGIIIRFMAIVIIERTSHTDTSLRLSLVKTGSQLLPIPPCAVPYVGMYQATFEY
jgi:hypothetical protein